MLIILPLLLIMALKLFTGHNGEGINISGAGIFFEIPLPIQNLPITEAQVNSLAVMLSVTGLCRYFTHGLSVWKPSKRQLIAEYIVEFSEKLVNSNMNEYFKGFAPFICAVLVLSGFSSLLSLAGLFPPTSDINICMGWAILVFILITFYKLKCGLYVYLKSFGKPVLFLAPLNVISEVATPISMAFRHYGNILSGTVVSVLAASGLQSLSGILLGRLPGIFGEFPLLQIGIPALLSIYFDIFSGILQAYIFAILTMLYVSGGFPYEEYLRRKRYENA